VVLVREDNPGDKRLVAYYSLLPEPGALSAEAIELSETAAFIVSAGALRAYLSSMLPEYMTPVAYVKLETLPLTPNGKLDRRALPEPEADAYAVREYEPPMGETETILARIWAELLDLERVGRHDNFFELGGHSLLAVSLIERMREHGLQADARSLYAAPTLAELAAVAEKVWRL